MQDGPEDRARRSRRTRAAEDRPAVDDPLFGPLPDEDGPADRPGATAGDLGDGYGPRSATPPRGGRATSPADATGATPRRRRAAPDDPADGPGSHPPARAEAPREPTGGRRRADRPVDGTTRDGTDSGPTRRGAPDPAAEPRIRTSGTRRRPAEADATGTPVPPDPSAPVPPRPGSGAAPAGPGERPPDARPARPRSAERTDSLPPVTPRGTPRPPAAEPPGRRRRSPADMRATEVISAILPRRRRAAPADDVAPAPAAGERPVDAGGQVAPGPSPEAVVPATGGDPADPQPAAGSDPAPRGDPPATEPPATGRAGTRGGRLLRITAAALATLVLVTTAAGFTSRNRIDDGIVTVPALDPTSDAISSVATQAGDENVLVLGLAADRLREPEAARTDTAVLVHVPEGGGPSVTLSLPATLEVSRPPCQRWDPASSTYGPTVPAESRTTLSSVFDVGGPRCSVGAVQQLTGLAVTRFVALDLSGAAGLVDAVRGVTVCTERPVVDQVLGPIVPAAGNTALDGPASVRFAGAAAVVDDTSPANRIQRQQRVLAAALDRALSTSALLTPGTPSRVARALSGSVLTDSADAAEVLTVARSLSRAGTAGDGSTPVFLPVPVNDAPNTRGHLELRRSDASDLFEAMREHEPLPESVTAPTQRAAAAVLPEGAEVDVLNAAGRAGLAGEVADSLRAQGFRVGSVSDAPEAADTVVRFSPDRAELAGTLTSSLPSAVPAPDPTASSTLQLVLGSGFSGPVTLPTQPPTGMADCG